MTTNGSHVKSGPSAWQTVGAAVFFLWGLFIVLCVMAAAIPAALRLVQLAWSL